MRGEWGALLQALFIGAAVALLIAFLLAEWPLRRLRVFISTHFYRNKYDYRIEWLRFVQTLSIGESRDARRNAIRAVAQIFGSPSGLLMLRDQDGGHVLSTGGLARRSQRDFPTCDASRRSTTHCRVSCASGSGSSTCTNTRRDPELLRRSRAARLARSRTARGA